MNAELKLHALRDVLADLEVGIAAAEVEAKQAEATYTAAMQNHGKKKAAALELGGVVKVLEAEIGAALVAALAEPPTAPQDAELTG